MLYQATAHKSSNVTHSLVASFTGGDTLNLIISRCTRLEIYVLETAGLRLLHDVPLYCRIATMELWRPQGAAADRLFISTERYQFCILSYDAVKKEIVTVTTAHPPPEVNDAEPPQIDRDQRGA